MVYVFDLAFGISLYGRLFINEIFFFLFLSQLDNATCFVFRVKKTIQKIAFVFLSLIFFLLIFFCRFDEVDEASPKKNPTIHEILLKGKRQPRLPFEDELRPPRGKFLTNCKT